MSDNRTRPLGELVRITRGKTYKSALLGQPGPVLLGLASIARNGGFRADSLRTYGGESPGHLLVHPGELFASLKDVTQSADLLGSVARVPKGGPTGRLTQDTVRLDIISPDVTSDYLYLSLLTPQYRSYCRAHATGTTNLGLPREDFLAFPIPIPSLDEQSRIAAVLGAFDDLIETNRVLVGDHWSALEAAYERTASVGHDTTVGKLLALRYGKSLPATRREPGPYPVVSSAGITGSHSSALVGGPGVVVGRKGTVGSVTWVFDDFFPIDTAFFVETELPMLYAYFALRGAGLNHMNTDSAVPGLNRDNALQRPARLPSGESLAEFKAATPPLVAAVRALESEITDLTRTRDELLPLLMSGRVRVADVEGVA